MSFILLCLCVAGIYYIGEYTFRSLVGYSDYIASSKRFGTYVIRPKENAFIFPALFITISIVFIIPIIIFRAFMGKKEYKKYINMQNWSVRFYTNKALKLIVSIFFIASLALAFLTIDTYATINQDGMHINKFWGIKTEYKPYSTVKELYNVMKIKAPSGNIIDNKHFVVIFDGDKWTPDSYVVPWIPYDKNDEILEYISKVSGKKIKVVEFELDI